MNAEMGGAVSYAEYSIDCKHIRNKMKIISTNH